MDGMGYKQVGVQWDTATAIKVTVFKQTTVNATE